MTCLRAPPEGRLNLDTQSPRHALLCLEQKYLCQARGRGGWLELCHRPSDWRTDLTLIIIGLGAAGTHGPEGQAAFSYERPLSAASTALAAKGRRGSQFS